MTLAFDEARLAAALDELAPPFRVLLAITCAERLWPAYATYALRTGRGDAASLRTLLSRLWDDLLGRRLSKAELASMLSTCMDLIPQEDDEPWVPEQPAAEDAASAAAYALRCRQTAKGIEAAWSARRAYEAIDQWAMHQQPLESSGGGGDAMLLAHPLVQAELERQQRDLNELQEAPHFSRQLALSLRNRASVEGQKLFVGEAQSGG